MRSAWSPYSGIFHVVRDLLYLKFSIKTCFKCSNLWSLLNYLPHVLSRPTCSRALLSTVPHAIRVVMPYLLHALRALVSRVSCALSFSCCACHMPYVFFYSSFLIYFRCFWPNTLICI